MADGTEDANEGDRHSFGSIHTALKLSALGDYLRLYTLALKNQPFRLTYVDAFAGIGTCHIRIGSDRLLVPGSASIAIECKPPFNRMVFIEKSRRRVQALQRLKDRASHRNITIVHGNANAALPQVIASLNRRNDRAIVFLDPYGMHVEWETLRTLAGSRICDVWYLFPLSGLYRQAARDAAAIDDDKARALTRTFGTDEWRTAFYEKDRQIDLFGASPSEGRTAEWSDMLKWMQGRLETIFAGVLEPKLLYQTRDDGGRGAPLFALFFAVSNPRARDLAMRLARSILKP
jgi:three-Cys-motif partner protein